MKLIMQEDEGERISNVRGGTGDGKIFKASLPEKDGSFTLASRIELSPGASIGLHQHTDDNEIYAVVSGEGIYSFDGGERELKTGDIFVTLKGMSHALKNTGNIKLIFFAIVAR